MDPCALCNEKLFLDVYSNLKKDIEIYGLYANYRVENACKYILIGLNGWLRRAKKKRVSAAKQGFCPQLKMFKNKA